MCQKSFEMKVCHENCKRQCSIKHICLCLDFSISLSLTLFQATLFTSFFLSSLSVSHFLSQASYYSIYLFLSLFFLNSFPLSLSFFFLFYSLSPLSCQIWTNLEFYTPNEISVFVFLLSFLWFNMAALVILPKKLFKSEISVNLTG